MSSSKINDRELLRLLDKEGLTQSEAARRLGVSRQPSASGCGIRGKTTRAVVAKKIVRWSSIRSILWATHEGQPACERDAGPFDQMAERRSRRPPGA